MLNRILNLSDTDLSRQLAITVHKYKYDTDTSIENMSLSEEFAKLKVPVLQQTGLQLRAINIVKAAGHNSPTLIMKNR